VTKVGVRKFPLFIAMVVVVVGGAVALNQSMLPKKPEYKCQSKTVEVEFQASSRGEVLPFDIEYSTTGNPVGEVHVRTNSWLLVEPAAACPGKATLHVENRRMSGAVNCAIWVNDFLVADRKTTGREACDLVVSLLAP
jgi:hypothetical protein